MKREEIQNLVEQVIRNVFEEMYFMSPEPVERDDSSVSIPESCFKAKVRVRNNPEMFVFYASERLVTSMAKNLLGTNEATEESDLLDVFREAANVMAGSLITSMTLDGAVGPEIPAVERLQACSEIETPQGAMFNVAGELFVLAFVHSEG